MTTRRLIYYHAYPHQVAGAQRVTVFLATEMRARGWDVEIVLPDEGPFADHARAAGLAVRVMRSGRSLRRYGRASGALLAIRRSLAMLVFWVRFYAYLRSAGRSVVHANDHRGVLTAALPARLAGRPVVWHAHGPLPRRGLNRLCALLASVVVAVSSDTLGQLSLRRRTLTRKACIVHNCIVGSGASAKSDSSEFAIDAPLIATGARLHPDKGLDVLLEAAARLRKHVADFKLVVAGHEQAGYEEHARELRAQLTDLDLTDHVRFVGHVKNPEALWRYADVYVQPSRLEPFGLCLLEAMSVRTPVVATAVGGMKEIIVDGVSGLLVPPDDAERLAVALERVLTDPGLHVALVRNGSEALHGHFSPERVIAQFENVYRRLADPGARPRVMRMGNAITLYTVQLNQLRRQRDAGLEVVLVTDDDEWGERLRREGFVVVPHQLSRRPSGAEYARFIVGTACLLRGSPRHTVIHTHNLAHSLAIRLVTPVLRSRQIVETIHNLHELQDSSLRNQAIRRALCLTRKNVSRSLFISQAYEDWAKASDLVVPERACVIGTGIDVAGYRARLDAAPSRSSVRRALGLSGDSRVAAVIARLEPQKGHALYLDAARDLQHDFPDLHHLFIGTGPLIEDLRLQTACSGLTERVHFLGFRDDIPALVAASDLVVLPSSHEGFGRCIVEGLAAGTPVVSTRTDGARLILDEGAHGVLCDADAGDLARGIRRVLTDEVLRERLQVDGPRRADEFDELPIADAVARIYGDLVA
jgi:glycosyltransferase involved in cell wall biosynthesis